MFICDHLLSIEKALNFHQNKAEVQPKICTWWCWSLSFILNIQLEPMLHKANFQQQTVFPWVHPNFYFHEQKLENSCSWKLHLLMAKYAYLKPLIIFTLCNYIYNYIYIIRDIYMNIHTFHIWYLIKNTIDL